MQRRDFARALLLGTGAACSLSLPTAYAALNGGSRTRLHAVLGRADATAGGPRWRAIEDCASGACPAAQRLRVAIDSLGFPVRFRPLVIDAMFATRDGLKPFRVATYQPGAISPVSKPFAFEVDAAGLAGFRVELAGTVPGDARITGSALLGASRPVLDAGRYLLAMGDTGHAPDLGMLQVPLDAAQSPFDAAAGDAPLAWLAFSVTPSSV
ncbi:MAG TPA: hypothetical protein PKC03_03925 [Dokdonella sp.]|nr:hypothetical protein [Dokdonella sp.]